MVRVEFDVTYFIDNEISTSPNRQEEGHWISISMKPNLIALASLLNGEDGKLMAFDNAQLTQS